MVGGLKSLIGGAIKADDDRGLRRAAVIVGDVFYLQGGVAEGEGLAGPRGGVTDGLYLVVADQGVVQGVFQKGGATTAAAGFGVHQFDGFTFAAAGG